MYKEECKTVIKEVKERVGYTKICDKCGVKREVIVDDLSEFDDDISSFSTSFGYGSSFDGESWSFDICESCLLDIFKTFKLVPCGFRQDSYSNFTQEEHQKIFEHWKKTNQWEEFKFKAYEELVERDGLFSTDYINQLIEKYHPNKPLLK